jgi:ABC-type molybdate transport system substrate-binding protein
MIWRIGPRRRGLFIAAVLATGITLVGCVSTPRSTSRAAPEGAPSDAIGSRDASLRGSLTVYAAASLSAAFGKLATLLEQEARTSPST